MPTGQRRAARAEAARPFEYQEVFKKENRNEDFTAEAQRTRRAKGKSGHEFHEFARRKSRKKTAGSKGRRTAKDEG
jgi:hypothetical protein